MTFFSAEVVTAPARLPIAATDDALARAVIEECERSVLWRAIVRQERRIVIDGELPSVLEIEPATTIVSLTHWTPTDAAVVVDASTYDVVSRDPGGTIIAPSRGSAWPEPEREIGAFVLTYMAGWEVTDTTNLVPSTVVLMLTRALEFRAGSGGMGDVKIGSIDYSVPDAYSTDAIPREIARIARAWAYRPVFIGRA